MSAPKHLWSGDWRRESETASAARGDSPPLGMSQPVDQSPPPEPSPGPSPPPKRAFPRPRVGRAAIVIGVAVIALGGAAWGASALLGSSASPTAAPHAAPAGVTTAPRTASSSLVSTRRVSWLGMEIVTQPPGVAVVQTVALRTPADQAGIEPGDAILAIDGRSVHGAEEISHVLAGLPSGSRVTLELAYGSSLSQVQLTLGKPPAVGP